MKAKIAAGAAAASLLLLGGCASPSPATEGATSTAAADQSVAAAVLTNAVVAAKEAGSARITGTITTTSERGTMTATLSGVHSFAPAAMDITVNSDAFAPGASVRQLLVDDMAFVQVPELGSKWLSIDLGEFAGTMSPLLADLDLSTLPDLQAAGTGTVEGAAVTYYSADVDLDQALQLAGLPADAQTQLDGKLAANPGTATVKIAIDEAGRLVEWKVNSTVNLADGGTWTSSADQRFYDFGVPTDISAPSAEDVIDSESLKGLLPDGVGVVE